LIAAALLPLAVGAMAAPAGASLPEVQRSGRVEYLSGGIGHDEAQAVQAEARRWPLTLEFAVNDRPRADFAADVAVKVRDARGHTALDTTASGPFLLMKLSPGMYKVDATLRGQTLHREVHVQAGHPTQALFLWPHGMDRPD
jgi:hypothetical protein